MYDVLKRVHNTDLGLLIIRIAVATIFIAHGMDKFGNMEGTVGFFASLGFAPFLAYFVASAEVVGGIALIAGIFTRYAGALLAIIMAVAIVVVHWQNGFNVGNGGYEFALTLMLGALALVFTGPGCYSLAAWMKSRRPEQV